ncbi:hypothetical protein GFS24_20165 [Chitinophaga sp. SYP-B3965]|uniref:hypothetical protein n=1 Tax=Chitinophaga sp. SYP-B3965 TaxID=2663120 RepID=UPI001299830D|nr:hypothetical protein [Chitinophaga sp. SYP-B3965]MRG47447.1 hypothetical protein [Chitinophaga sp. SYP-B3965]
MKEITLKRDYSIIQAQTNTPTAVLFYAREDVESELAEISMNNLDRLYASDMHFSKIAVDSKHFLFEGQHMVLPFVKIMDDGYPILFRNRIDFKELESRIRQILERKKHSALSSQPPQIEVIKTKILNIKWVAWTAIIGAALIAIIKFVIEVTKDNNSNKR